MWDFWIGMAGIVFGNIFLIVVVLALWKTRQRKLELQAEVQTKLIERFGSTPELVDFLQSPAGREFVSGVQKGTVTLSRDRVLAGVRRAIILAALGVAFAALWIVFDASGFSIPAIICFALGVGYLLATYVSLKLSRRLDAAGEPAREQ